jgi:hypothetical protein
LRARAAKILGSFEWTVLVFFFFLSVAAHGCARAHRACSAGRCSRGILTRCLAMLVTVRGIVAV